MSCFFISMLSCRVNVCCRDISVQTVVRFQGAILLTIVDGCVDIVDMKLYVCRYIDSDPDLNFP